MRIEITLNDETITEDDEIVPGGLYVAEYNAFRGVHGYNSSDIDKYNALRLNEKLINRAIINAEDNESDVGVGKLKNRTCSIKLFYSNRQ